jgi:hypothetical protein
MIIHPVLGLLLIDLLLFLAAVFVFDKSAHRWESLLLSVLFFASGMPALIYQVVWQRALFAIYGVNVESVAGSCLGWVSGASSVAACRCGFRGTGFCSLAPAKWGWPFSAYSPCVYFIGRLPSPLAQVCFT